MGLGILIFTASSLGGGSTPSTKGLHFCGEFLVKTAIGRSPGIHSKVKAKDMRCSAMQEMMPHQEILSHGTLFLKVLPNIHVSEKSA